MSHARVARRRAFSLVELLVVLGIIALLLGILLPAVMYARKSGREARCQNNLKQLGAFLLMYANVNDDKLICGTTDQCNELNRSRWRTDWNVYAWYEGKPSGALGPFVVDGTLHRDNWSLVYCPVDKREAMYPEVWTPRWPYKRQPPLVDVLKIGYAVRPERKLWGHAFPGTGGCQPPPIAPSVVYPVPMPRLSEFRNQAIMADVIGVERYGHGSDKSPQVNVLYGDGSVVRKDVPRPDPNTEVPTDAAGPNRGEALDPSSLFNAWWRANPDLPKPTRSADYGDNAVLMQAWKKLDRTAS